MTEAATASLGAAISPVAIPPSGPDATWASKVPTGTSVLSIRIFDPDIGGTYDTISGMADTDVSYRVVRPDGSVSMCSMMPLRLTRDLRMPWV